MSPLSDPSGIAEAMADIVRQHPRYRATFPSFDTGDTVMDDSTGVTYNEYFSILRSRMTERELWIETRRGYWTPILGRLRNARIDRLEAKFREAVGPEMWSWYEMWGRDGYD